MINYWPTPAFANEVLRLYVAEGLVAGRQDPDDDEFIEAVPLPLAAALDYIRRGKIKDSKTLIGLLACAAWRK